MGVAKSLMSQLDVFVHAFSQLKGTMICVGLIVGATHRIAEI